MGMFGSRGGLREVLPVKTCCDNSVRENEVDNSQSTSVDDTFLTAKLEMHRTHPHTASLKDDDIRSNSQH